MKKFYQFFIIILIANNIYASVKCGDAKFTRTGGENGIYHFTAVTRCKFINEAIKVNLLKDMYRDEIIAGKSQFVIHDQNYDIDKRGSSDYKLDVTQNYMTRHGPLTVRADVIITANDNNFSLRLRSKSVSGDGEASITRSVQKIITISLAGNDAELTVTKVIDVAEPWYAPKFIFFAIVEKELTESINDFSKLNARKILGEPVHALHD